MAQPFPVATARYQAGGAIVTSGLAPIRITLGKPRMWLAYSLAGQIPMLAPTASEFRISDEQLFADAYRARINNVGADAVVKSLTAMNGATGNKGLVLLCFENLAVDAMCHRRLLADFLTDTIGWDVPELPEQ